MVTYVLLELANKDIILVEILLELFNLSLKLSGNLTNLLDCY